MYGDVFNSSILRAPDDASNSVAGLGIHVAVVFVHALGA